MDDAELDAIREAAAREGLTVSEWVRHALRQARRHGSTGDVQRKLGTVRAAARHAFPTGDIDTMLEEIERGYQAP